MLTKKESLSTPFRITSRHINRLKASMMHTSLAFSLVLFTPSPSTSAISTPVPPQHHQTTSSHLATGKIPLS